MDSSAYTVSLILPTCNAANWWADLCAGIQKQSHQAGQVIIIDSASTDGTDHRALEAGFDLIRIKREEFDHGGTRQLGAQYAGCSDILLYLVQDATPHDEETFSQIIRVFDDPSIGAAYGRQLPRKAASALEAHARLFNYPATPQVRSLEMRRRLGFKSIFLSNSFAAYRREALMEVGGFPTKTIFGEDTIVAARMHLRGWKTAYVPEAMIYHSHAYSIREEFSRYFDIGVLHARERWLIEQFGSTNREGMRFLSSELGFLMQNDCLAIPSALLRTVTKYLGYQAGKHEDLLSPRVKQRLGRNRAYWVSPAGQAALEDK